MEASYSEVGVLIELSFGKKFEIVGKWAGLNAKQKEIRKYHTPSKPRLPRHLLPLFYPNQVSGSFLSLHYLLYLS